MFVWRFFALQFAVGLHSLSHFSTKPFHWDSVVKMWDKNPLLTFTQMLSVHGCNVGTKPTAKAQANTLPPAEVTHWFYISAVSLLWRVRPSRLSLNKQYSKSRYVFVRYDITVLWSPSYVRCYKQERVTIETSMFGLGSKALPGISSLWGS